MQLGMIGLGRHGGANHRAAASRRKAHEWRPCFDQNAGAIGALAKEGATAGSDLSDLVRQVEGAACSVGHVCRPAKITEDTVEQLGALLAKGDIIIDGGNSFL